MGLSTRSLLAPDERTWLLWGRDPRAEGHRPVTFPAGAVRSITMRLGAGNDVLHGSGELSRYVTKSGERTLTRADWKLEVHGGAGNDLLVGSNGSETLRGGAGDDSISGGLGDDSTYGDEGNDLLSEHDGVDRMDGGGGDDVLVMVWPGSPVGKRYPKAYGGSGSDQIFLPEVSKSYFGTRIEAVHRVDFHSGFKPDLNMGWVPA